MTQYILYFFFPSKCLGLWTLLTATDFAYWMKQGQRFSRIPPSYCYSKGNKVRWTQSLHSCSWFFYKCLVLPSLHYGFLNLPAAKMFSPEVGATHLVMGGWDPGSGKDGEEMLVGGEITVSIVSTSTVSWRTRPAWTFPLFCRGKEKNCVSLGVLSLMCMPLGKKQPSCFIFKFLFMSLAKLVSAK